MPGLVSELQQAAMDGNVKVADVLRKALVVTKKLRVPTIEQWIAHELEGYGTDDVPDYRKLILGLRVWNPYHGYQPLIVRNREFAEALSLCNVGQALAQLEGLLVKESRTLQVPFTPAEEAFLMSNMQIPLRPVRVASRTQVEGIIDAVRNHVLTWSLELQSEGVVGAGITFTAEEREAALHVTNITNNIGTMQNSQLQQASPQASQQQSIENHLPELSGLVEALNRASLKCLAPDDVAELKAEIATLKAQTQSPKPKMTVIHEGLKSVRAILERAAGSVVTAEVLPLVIAVMHRLSG